MGVVKTLSGCSQFKMQVSMQDSFLCKICNNFASHTYSKVLRHIGLVHSFDPGFSVTCGVDGCPRTFTKYNSFRKHILRHHRFLLQKSRDVHQDNHVLVNECSDNNLQSSRDDVIHTSNDVSNYDESSTEVSQAARSALFILKAKECLKISQVALNTMLDDIDILLQSKLQETKHKVLGLLSCTNVSEEIATKTREIFNSDKSMFSGLHTAYSQNKYFVDHLGLVVCLI